MHEISDTPEPQPTITLIRFYEWVKQRAEKAPLLAKHVSQESKTNDKEKNDVASYSQRI